MSAMVSIIRLAGLKKSLVHEMKFNARPLIVIVIVIGYLLGATFFPKDGALIFAFLGITTIERHSTYIKPNVPPLCLRSASTLRVEMERQTT